MTKIAKSIFAVATVMLYSCQSAPDNQSPEQESCLPNIVIETNKDTLHIGEQYIAQVSLDDTSYYYFNEDGKRRRTNPVFRINGQLVESKGRTYVYKETVIPETADTLQSGTVIRDWSVGIIFPHPNGGDVEVSYRTGYVIEDKPSSTAAASP